MSFILGREGKVFFFWHNYLGQFKNWVELKNSKFVKAGEGTLMFCVDSQGSLVSLSGRWHWQMNSRGGVQLLLGEVLGQLTKNLRIEGWLES